jgi:hypothetical protein
MTQKRSAARSVELANGDVTVDLQLTGEASALDSAAHLYGLFFVICSRVDLICALIERGDADPAAAYGAAEVMREIVLLAELEERGPLGDLV